MIAKIEPELWRVFWSDSFNDWMYHQERPDFNDKFGMLDLPKNTPEQTVLDTFAEQVDFKEAFVNFYPEDHQ